MQRRQTKALRLTCAVAAAVFLFFLIELTPHRVHHMFDEKAENTCVAFTLSKGCALSAPSAPYVAAFTFTLQLFPAFTKVWISYLSPSPFRKRAPPAL
jgi:hypothetical protein